MIRRVQVVLTPVLDQPEGDGGLVCIDGVDQGRRSIILLLLLQLRRVRLHTIPGTANLSTNASIMAHHLSSNARISETNGGRPALAFASRTPWPRIHAHTISTNRSHTPPPCLYQPKSQLLLHGRAQRMGPIASSAAAASRGVVVLRSRGRPARRLIAASLALLTLLVLVSISRAAAERPRASSRTGGGGAGGGAGGGGSSRGQLDTLVV